jgi:hypothetical protein
MTGPASKMLLFASFLTVVTAIPFAVATAPAKQSEIFANETAEWPGVVIEARIVGSDAIVGSRLLFQH